MGGGIQKRVNQPHRRQVERYQTGPGGRTSGLTEIPGRSPVLPKRSTVLDCSSCLGKSSEWQSSYILGIKLSLSTRRCKRGVIAVTTGAAAARSSFAPACFSFYRQFLRHKTCHNLSGFKLPYRHRQESTYTFHPAPGSSRKQHTALKSTLQKGEKLCRRELRP